MAQNRFVNLCTMQNGFCLHSEGCREISVNAIAQRPSEDIHRMYEGLLAGNEIINNLKWDNTLRMILSGVALHKRVTNGTNDSFGAALNRCPTLNARLSTVEKKRLCKKISTIRRIFRNWPKIITNCCHDDMVHIDVRTFSINMLAKAHNFREVEKLNEIHAPQSTRTRREKPNAAFTQAEVELIAQSVRSHGIIQRFNSDPEQIDLLISALRNKLHED